jgi:Protein of unknown function (DUF1573)
MWRTATLVAVAAACLAARAGLDRDAPTRERHDFGAVTQAEKVVHAFTVRNDGAAPLGIERVDLSEAGMTARFARVIPPGAEGQVRIEWQTGLLAGEVEAEAIVHFTAEARPPLRLSLRGVVRPSIELLPYPAVFASVFAGEAAERHVRIVNHEARPLAITRVDGGGRLFAAALETLQAGRVYDLRVRLPAGRPPGRYEETVYLDTDHPQRARIPIPVHLLVKTDVYANPEVVDFGTVSLDELARAPSLVDLLTQTTLLKKRAGEFQIKAIASDLDLLRITRQPEGRSGTFRIDVGLQRQRLRRGPIDGSIRVATDDGAFPEVVIGVRGELR